MDKIKLEQSIRDYLKLDNEIQLNIWYNDYGSNRVFVQYTYGKDYEEKLYMFGVDKDNSKVIMKFDLVAKWEE